MKKVFFIICVAAMQIAIAQKKKIVVVKKTIPLKSNAVVLKNAIDSFSYALGYGGASYYKSQGVGKMNIDLVRRAFDDVLNNKPPLITPETCNNILQKKNQELMNIKDLAESQNVLPEKEAGKKFLAENKKRPGVVELPDGLQYEIIKEGTGEMPKITDTVKAHYIGTLINGTEFDNSYKRGEPLQIPVGGVIQGWVQALQLMPVGSKWKLYIPSELGYGDRGAGGTIPGGATLIFVIELLGIVK